MFGKKRSKPKKYTFKRGLMSIIALCIVGFLFVVWVIMLYPHVEYSLPVWALFTLFYILVVAFWALLFYGLFGLSGKGGAKYILVMSFITAILDLFYPPFAVNMDGSLVTGDSAGYRGSIDFTAGYYLSRLGLSGPLVFIFTYLIIPIIGFMIILVLLRPKKFRELMKKAE